MAQEVQSSKVTGTTLVDVKGLKVYFPIKGGIFNRTVAQVKAVETWRDGRPGRRKWLW